jgi:hypothetical protein
MFFPEPSYFALCLPLCPLQTLVGSPGVLCVSLMDLPGWTASVPFLCGTWLQEVLSSFAVRAP